MQRITTLLFFVGAACGCTSLLYFFSLLLHLPAIFAVALVLVVCVLLYRYLVTGVRVASGKEYMPGRAFWILAGGVVLFCLREAILAHKYGGWDAIALWNLYARFLSDPEHWARMYRYTEGHPDYPLMIPGLTAFFWRWTTPDAPGYIPFCFSVLFAVLTPVVIFLELYRRHLQLATLSFLVFLTNFYFLIQGVDQYADICAGLFLLLTLIAFNYYKKLDSGKMLFLCGVMLGCSMWTKNEGLMHAVLFLLFFGRQILAAGKRAWLFVAGIIPFAIGLLVLKLGYAPPNDLLDGAGKEGGLSLLFDKERHHLVFSMLAERLDRSYYALKVALLLYVFSCVVRRRFPEKKFWFLLAIAGAYVVVYLLTPHDLGWQLDASLERIILHMFPLAIYIVGDSFATYLPLAKPDEPVAGSLT